MNFEVPEDEPSFMMVPTKRSDKLDVNLDWRGALSQVVKAALSPPPARRTGKCLYQVGEHPPLTLTAREDAVLHSLISLGGTATLSELRDASDVEDANKILSRICRKYDLLRPYIILPGGRDKSGYRTTITK